MLNTDYLQPLLCEYLMILYVIKLNLFRFWADKPLEDVGFKEMMTQFIRLINK